MKNKIKTYTKTLIDDDGIELLVTFDYYWEEQKEEGHGEHDLSGWNIQLNYVELVLAGASVKFNGEANILKYFSLGQYLAVLGKIDINEIEDK